MDPFTIAVLFAVGALVGGAVYVAFLTFEYLIDWFLKRAAKVQGNPQALAVTVTEELANGRVNYVQGIFDKQNGAFLEARKIKTDNVDDRVRGAHAGNRVTVWQ